MEQGFWSGSCSIDHQGFGESLSWVRLICFTQLMRLVAPRCVWTLATGDFAILPDLVGDADSYDESRRVRRFLCGGPHFGRFFESIVCFLCNESDHIARYFRKLGRWQIGQSGSCDFVGRGQEDDDEWWWWTMTFITGSVPLCIARV